MTWASFPEPKAAVLFGLTPGSDKNFASLASLRFRAKQTRNQQQQESRADLTPLTLQISGNQSAWSQESIRTEAAIGTAGISQ